MNTVGGGSNDHSEAAEDLAEDLAHAFRLCFDARPDGVWFAPGRVNLIGEHTDYNGGLVLPFAIQLGVRAAVHLRSDMIIRVASLQQEDMSPGTHSGHHAFPDHPEAFAEARLDELAPAPASGWTAYPLGVAWALRGHGLDRGADILLDGTVPRGAGLSSSAALECAVAIALDELAGLGVPREDLVTIARHAENSFAGVPCGAMDQSAALLCTAGHALLLDSASGERTQVPFSPEAHDLAILVINSGAGHQLAASPYHERLQQCRMAARELGVEQLGLLELDDLPSTVDTLSDDLLRHRVRHVVSENARVREVADLLASGRLRELGPVLTAGHRSLAKDYEVSTAIQDLSVQASLSNGALGARMVGGGFGGSVIALVERRAIPDFTRSIEAELAGKQPDGGLADPPHIFEAISANGARRVG